MRDAIAWALNAIPYFISHEQKSSVYLNKEDIKFDTPKDTSVIKNMATKKEAISTSYYPSFNNLVYSGDYVAVIGRSLLEWAFKKATCFNRDEVKYKPYETKCDLTKENVQNKVKSVLNYTTITKSEKQKDSKDAVKILDDPAEGDVEDIRPPGEKKSLEKAIVKVSDNGSYVNTEGPYTLYKPHKSFSNVEEWKHRKKLKEKGVEFHFISPGRGDKTLVWTDLTYFHTAFRQFTRKGLSMMVRLEIIPLEAISKFRVASIETGALYKLKTTKKHGMVLTHDKKYGTVINMPDTVYFRHAQLLDCGWMDKTENRKTYFEAWKKNHENCIINDKTEISQYSACYGGKIQMYQYNIQVTQNGQPAQVTRNAQLITPNNDRKILNTKVRHKLIKLTSFKPRTPDDLINCSRKQRINVVEVMASRYHIPLSATVTTAQKEDFLIFQNNQTPATSNFSASLTSANSALNTPTPYYLIPKRPELDHKTLASFTPLHLSARDVFYTTVSMTLLNIPKLEDNYVNLLEGMQFNTASNGTLSIFKKYSLARGPYPDWPIIWKTLHEKLSSSSIEMFFGDHWITFAKGIDEKLMSDDLANSFAFGLLMNHEAGFLDKQTLDYTRTSILIESVVTRYMRTALTEEDRTDEWLGTMLCHHLVDGLIPVNPMIPVETLKGVEIKTPNNGTVHYLRTDGKKVQGQMPESLLPANVEKTIKFIETVSKKNNTKAESSNQTEPTTVPGTPERPRDTTNPTKKNNTTQEKSDRTTVTN